MIDRLFYPFFIVILLLISSGPVISSSVAIGEIVTLNSPADRLISVKDTILLKGMFLKNGRVLVNGHAVPVKAGRFATNITLPTPGKYLLSIDFIDRDEKKITLTRRIHYFAQYRKPPIRKYSPKSLAAVFNEPTIKLHEHQGVSRELMAKILVLLEDTGFKRTRDIELIDVPDSYEYAPFIKAAVKHNLLDPYPDGSFRPKEYMTKAQLLWLVARMDHVTIPLKAHTVIFQDVPLTHWVAPIVEAGVESGLIKAGENFSPNDTPNVKSLMALMSRVPTDPVGAGQLVDFDSGFSVELTPTISVSGAETDTLVARTPEIVIGASSPNLTKLEPPVVRVMKPVSVSPKAVTSHKVPRVIKLKALAGTLPKKLPPQQVDPDISSSSVTAVMPYESESSISATEERDEASISYNFTELEEKFPNVFIAGLTDHYIARKPRLVIKGKITRDPKIYSLCINNKPVKISAGQFVAKVNLPPGRSDVSLTVNNKHFLLKVKRVVRYKDVPPTFWCYKTLNNLEMLHYLPEVEVYKPNGSLTRKELAYTLARVFNLQSDNDNEVLASDMDKKSKYFKCVDTVLSNKLMYIDDNGKFNPDGRVKKADVIVYLASIFSVDENAKTEPFKDVTLEHYAVDEIAYFKAQKIISDTENFYPEKYISRAQFAAIIARLPKVRDEIKNMDKW